MSKEIKSILLETEGIQLLHEYSIPYPDYGVAHSIKQAINIADEMGYPVVLKIISPDVPHKTNVGGVVVNLESAESIREAYERIETSVQDVIPMARIEGMLVCRHEEPGLEVIVGGLRDALFGPTVMFGMGGIFVEILRDISCRVVPIKRRDAEEMIEEIKGSALFRGARGRDPYDVAAVVELLGNVSNLLINKPEICELDLNPVRVYRKGLVVLDVRAFVSRA